MLVSTPVVLAVTLTPSEVTVTVPTGSNNGTRNGSSSQPYIDDVFLNRITFGGATYTSSGSSYRAVSYATVITGRNFINAEYGDSDTGSDGNANPYVQAGIVAEGAILPDTIRESTDPNIQDPAITASFNSLSLTQGIDGEGTDYTFDIFFQNSIFDNSSSADQAPELVFFERGANSDFSIQLILGGTTSDPVLGNTLNILRSELFGTNIFIDTIEINGGQRLGVAGLDLSDFGIAANTPVFGVRIGSLNNSGADLYGAFTSAVNPATQYGPSLVNVPEPGLMPAVLSFGLIGGIGVSLQRRKRSAR